MESWHSVILDDLLRSIALAYFSANAVTEVRNGDSFEVRAAVQGSIGDQIGLDAPAGRGNGGVIAAPQSLAISGKLSVVTCRIMYAETPRATTTRR